MLNDSMSEQELRDLLILTYLGAWMANAHRNKPLARFEKAASRVYEMAKETPLASWVHYDSETGLWQPEAELEQAADPLIDEYDEDTFSTELVDRLAQRDAMEEFGEKKFNTLNGMDRVGAIDPYERHYQEEFANHGLNTLRAVRAVTKNPAGGLSGASTEIGVAWYHDYQWDRLLEIAADRDTLEKDHADWLESAIKTWSEMKNRGIHARRVWIDVESLKTWCDAQDIPVTGASRSKYVIEALKDRADKHPDTPPHNDIGRNDPCPCGSGKKHKKCCLA